MENLRGLIPYASETDANTGTIRFRDVYGNEKSSILTNGSVDRNVCYMIKDIFDIEYHEFERVVGNMGDNDDDEWRECIRKAYIFFYNNQDIISEYGLRVKDIYDGDQYSNLLGFTFGLNIRAYLEKLNYIGFTYIIRLNDPHSRHISQYYIGQKSFNRGSDWRFYTSSSEHVNKKLELGWYAEYDILTYHSTQEEMDAVENDCILRTWNSSTGREESLNYSCVVNGVRVLKYDYLGPEQQGSYYRKNYRRRY